MHIGEFMRGQNRPTTHEMTLYSEELSGTIQTMGSQTKAVSYGRLFRLQYG